MAATTVRFTITVPIDLKQRMDAVAGLANWSAVASRAFEVELMAIETRRKRSMSKEDVVKRLKAEQEHEKQTAYEGGKEAGRLWAERTATPKQLRRLSDYIDEYDTTNVDWWDIDYPGWSAPRGATCNFALAVMGLDPAEADREVAGDFWAQAVVGDAELDDAEFLHGFGDGAVEVWDEVKDEL